MTRSYECVGGCMHGEVHESHENESVTQMFFAQCEATGNIHQYLFCDQKQVWEFFNELEMPRRAGGDATKER